MDKTTKFLAISAVIVILLAAGIWAVVLNNSGSDNTTTATETYDSSSKSSGSSDSGSSDSSDSSGSSSSDSSDSSVDTEALAVEEGTAADVVKDVSDSEWVEINLADNASTGGSNVDIDGNKITIEAGGYYRISGELSDGRIVVKAADTDEVVLCLAGVSIISSSEEAIRVKTAASVTIYLEDGTENTLVSGTAVEITENPNEDGEEETAEETVDDDTTVDAALHSKVDTVICGDGTLNVYGYINNGIQVKTNLTIEGGNINVEAVNNGIKGKTSVAVTGGDISVICGNDGIKSDGTEDGQGYITLAGGNISINSYGDGVQAGITLLVSGGSLDITTVGDESVTNNTDSFMGHGWGSADSGWDMAAETSVSTKGLKAGSQITVSGGTVNIDASDDGIHSNGDVDISGGTITIASGDDGIHSDATLTISDGSLTVTESYEGLEAVCIYIKGGDTSITASDDGLNASDGTGDVMGFGWNVSGDTDVNLYVQGGTLYVNAGGDGLDSNGGLYIQGGVTIVDGPTDSANGALDSGTTIEVSGGTILAIGSSGMAESFGSSSSQCSFMVTLSSWSAGDTITITDSKGNVLFTHDAAKSGDCIIFSSEDLTEGETYTITAGSQSTTITQSSVSSSSSGSGGMNGGMGGGMGGRR